MFTNLGCVSTKTLRVTLVVALGATLAALTAVALVVVSPAARAADGNCQTSGSEVVCTFGTPGTSIWTVPEGVSQATFAVSGAEGERGEHGGVSSGGAGGLGGEARATFSNLHPTSQLQVNVGRLAGGGLGGTPRGGAGGGASDVRLGFSNGGPFTLADRIIVGGGGGGGGGGTASGCTFVGSESGGRGGSGGGSSGGGGANASSGDAGGGGGGTQTAGGFGGFGAGDGGGSGSSGGLGGGGNGGNPDSCGGGGGGGGAGYYGGGGGGGGDVVFFGGSAGGAGGGGGSGYVSSQGATDVQFLGNVQSGNGRVTITYTLPTGPPELSISDTTVSEGNSGTSQAEFTVSLSEPSTQPVTVTYATNNGTAAAGEDYVGAPSGSTLTFAPGDTSMTISVTVNGDTLNEPDETFFVNLSNPANATISDEKGIGTITNDDPPPDTQAPTVITTYPEANGTMGKADLVTATFSEEVKGVSEQTFFLKQYTLSKNGRETYVPVTAKVTTPNDITAVLNPAKDLARGTYQATITNDVTDKAGNALVPKTWSFTVVR